MRRFGCITRTPEEMADMIEAFLEGTDAPTDWDDFTSIRIDDDELDGIRERCNKVYDDFSSNLTEAEIDRSTNPNIANITREGQRMLRELVRMLRAMH